MTERRLSARQVCAIAGVLGVLFAATVAVRTQQPFPVGLPGAGTWQSNVVLSFQLAVVVAGVAAVNLVRASLAPYVLIAEGAVLLLAHGWRGLVWAAGMLFLWVVLSARWLGRARVLILALVLVGMNACSLSSPTIAATAATFSMLFTMRLLMLTWDRWQNDLEPPPLREYLLYMLAPPLVLFPPYMLFIPFFTGFWDKVRPGLTVAVAGRAAKHMGLTLLFAAIAGAMHAATPPSQPAYLYWTLVRHVLDAGVFAHLVIALLLLHGIDERLPIVRPLLATRFLHFWQRFQVHQKDAQVFLFFAPALLRLRRLNRYLVFWLAAAWTMLFGNTIIHIVSRYFFLPNTLDRVEWILVGNAIMTVVLATEMCIDEWRSRHPSARPAPRWLALPLGWAVTQTIAAIVTDL